MKPEIDTCCVHAGREEFAELGVHAPPLDLSTTYPLPQLDEAVASLDALAAGRAPEGSPIYARLHNPTVARFERGLARLEGADAAAAFSSGMAALTACLLDARTRGRHVIATRPLYGGSDHLLSSGLLGLEVSWVEPEAAAVTEALRSDTSLVLLETPANPTLRLVDIAEVVDAAQGVPVVVDSTFATPILQRPLELGASLVLHSGTKFLGGHGDVLAGVVAGDEERIQALRRIRVATGAVLHPLGGYLLHRGLQTLSLRVERSQASARVLAERLAGEPVVARVHYPESDARADLIGRQMAGPGSLVAFEVSGGGSCAARVLAACRLIVPAVSLGSCDTLIQHPAGLTHRVVDPEARASSGVGDGLLRVSVGLEDVEDLWRDLSNALAVAAIAELHSEARRVPVVPDLDRLSV